MSLLKILGSKEKEKTCNEEINEKDVRNNFLLSKTTRFRGIRSQSMIA